MKNRLKEMRETKRLTQKEVGEKVGVSRQAINAIETGKFDPSIWLAYDLAKLFDLSIEELFDFEGGKRKCSYCKIRISMLPSSLSYLFSMQQYSSLQAATMNF